MPDYGRAKRLRGDGVEVILDRWQLKPGHDKFAFMERAIDQANFVLMICTPKYAEKANQRNGGVGYEATIITPELAGRVSQSKFLHILRDGDWEDDAIRKLVKGRIGFDLRGREYDDEYESLIRHLHDAADPPPPVGPRPNFTAKVSGPEAVPNSEHPRRGVRFSQFNQDLSPKEVELLWTTAQDPRGQLLHSKTLEGEGIRANDRHFLSNADIRSGVEWLGALQSLEGRGFVEPLSEERDFFRLTGTGLEAADRLEGFRRWDSNAVVLRAHYINASPQEYSVPCGGIIALPPAYFDAADGADMRSLKEPRSLLVEDVDSALQLEWSPNEVEFVDAITGNDERFRVRQMQVRRRCLKFLLE